MKSYHIKEENIQAFLSEMNKELGLPYKADADLDLADYGIVQYITEFFKKKGIDIEKIDVSDVSESSFSLIFRSPNKLTGQRLWELTRESKNSAFSCYFKYNSKNLIVTICAGEVEIYIENESVPEVVKKYGIEVKKN